jgi:uncharacterized protein (TIGR04141 family)
MQPTLSRRPTRPVTLYRLAGVRPDVDGMFDALDIDALTAKDFDIGFPPALPMPAVVITGRFARSAPEWRTHFATTTGLDFTTPESHGAGLLLIAVDEHVYAIGYGAGFRLVPEDKKDARFGLRVAIRVLDPAQVRDLVRRSPTLYGRTDSTIVPGGMPIWAFGIEEHTDVVGRAGGTTTRLDLTGARQEQGITIEGAAGLRLRLGVLPDDLVADLREIERALNRPAQPGLEFIDAFQPVTDDVVLALLDEYLDERLGSDEPTQGTGHIHVVVPTAKLRDFDRARGFVIKVGSVRWRCSGLDIRYLLQRTLKQPSGTRVEALRKGRVELFSDPGCTEQLSGGSALKWLETSVMLDERAFLLMDGSWYEIGTDYLATKRREVDALISTESDVYLPPWDAGWDEQRYNLHVADALPGALCLDRKGVRTGLHRHNGVEACDVLTRDDVFVHVKKADGSSPLSHLFAQGLVSIETIATPEGGSRFAALVDEVSCGRRTIGLPYRPRKIVFAILLKNGERLTTDTLFPFSQVMLANVARTIHARYGIPMEVVGIRTDR